MKCITSLLLENILSNHIPVFCGQNFCVSASRLTTALTIGSYAQACRAHCAFLICRMDITIAPVTPAGVPTLLDLIHELARFERLEHEVEATVESLNQSLFGPQPAAGALFARGEGEVAGYAIYFFTFSSFVGRAGIWLEDVYVRPQFRQRAD